MIQFVFRQLRRTFCFQETTFTSRGEPQTASTPVVVEFGAV